MTVETSHNQSLMVVAVTAQAECKENAAMGLRKTVKQEELYVCKLGKLLF